ncbi:hypothetical protein ASU33_18300 [Solirubrum puertoriconensis]|uniref:Rieske domain-containing protein n=2 Tax=Solirubrum puertoriconensis TaxID=1751427 RepID=A0A9X0HPA1_SOLP1|nr:hypothetical protein ASU33_18300 [Solirubrum puertoriconensis]
MAHLRFALLVAAISVTTSVTVCRAQSAANLGAPRAALGQELALLTKPRASATDPTGTGKKKTDTATPHTHTDSTRLVVFHRPVSTQPDVEVSINGDIVGNIADKGFVLVLWPNAHNELSLCPNARSATGVAVHPQHCRINYYELVPGSGKHAATLKPVSAKEGEFYVRLLQQRAKEQSMQAARR